MRLQNLVDIGAYNQQSETANGVRVESAERAPVDLLKNSARGFAAAEEFPYSQATSVEIRIVLLGPAMRLFGLRDVPDRFVCLGQVRPIIRRTRISCNRSLVIGDGQRQIPVQV